MTSAVLRAMTMPAAALVAVIALGGLFAPAAVRAGEYCGEDYSFTRNCSFSSMEQCKAAISGMNAACLRDPFFKHDSAEAINSNSNSDAYADLPSHRARVGTDTAAKAHK
jgi:hypothetical protein